MPVCMQLREGDSGDIYVRTYVELPGLGIKAWRAPLRA